eukprot:30364-Eustigmatos_ZCMA.PRE.1
MGIEEDSITDDRVVDCRWLSLHMQVVKPGGNLVLTCSSAYQLPEDSGEQSLCPQQRQSCAPFIYMRPIIQKKAHQVEGC